MFSKEVIHVNQLGKCYKIYERPIDRLLQALWPRKKSYFKEFWALREISFTVKQGETIGIMGLNGSGKSTLLQLICGTLNPTTGTATTVGRVAALLELGAGFNPEFTGRENVFLCAALYGVERCECEQRFAAIAEFADIGDFMDQKVKTYSSGMYVRLAFAVIVNIDADILVIDEALAVGDAFFTQKCMRFLREFKKQGTLIFVSHDSNSVLSLCDRALWLDKGILLMDASPKEVTAEYHANLYELQQGASDESFCKKIDTVKSESNTNEQATLFEINPQSSSFGNGDARIEQVYLENSKKQRVNCLVGGEALNLCIQFMVKKNIHQPIVGFHIKDRLGQVIFGDNTYLTFKKEHCSLKSEELVLAKFSFIMPVMRKGFYSITAAVANGSMEHHIQLHWIHDAAVFEMRASEVFCDGLIAIPMDAIKLNILKSADLCL